MLLMIVLFLAQYQNIKEISGYSKYIYKKIGFIGVIIYENSIEFPGRLLSNCESSL